MSNSSLAAGNDPVAESIRRAVSGYAAAWLAGDRQAMLASYHDDFTLHYFGRNPLAGIHRGKPAALAILAEVTRRSHRKLSGIVDVMAGPERGALLVREIFQRDGKTAEVERLLVYSVSDELLWQCWVYDQDQALVDAFLA
ncbi:MAG TPA: nuclear transport factor 2 family protein [Bradyrhizobium sp.]|nr:nuclear transport factor 2 family protein [Bradyrhizobium sp.]